jgi:hypothetical protein
MPHVPRPGALLAAASLSPAELRARAEAVLAAGDYQRALPEEPAPPAFQLSLGPLELLVRILLWTALAVLVVLAVSWLVRRLAAGARDVEVAEPAGAAAVPELRLESAAALAAAGRWAEAIHALLLETLEALSRAARLAPSLTSREIVERVRLPAPARDALEGLVVAVELSRFGGAPAGEGDYRACLSRFRAFQDATRSAA